MPELLIWAAAGSGLFFFVLWPFGAVLWESFLEDGSFSLAAYRGLARQNWPLVVRSFVLAFCVVLAAVPFALAGALHLVYGPRQGRAILLGALTISTISPPFLCSTAYLMLFGRRGLVTWRLLGLEWNPYGFHGVLAMEVLSVMGLTTLLIAASLRQTDGALEGASLDLGASPLRTLVSITLPLAGPGIASAAVMAFVRSLSDFGTPLFVGGRFQVLASRAYNVLIGLGDFPQACAMNVLLLVPALALIALGPRREQDFSMGLAQERALKLPRWSLALTGSMIWTFALIQFLVYGLIFLGALTRTWGVDFSWSMRHLSALWNFQASSYLRSLSCAFTAAIGGVLLGCLLARLTIGASPKLRRIVQILLDLPYLLPGTFFGLGYLLVSSSLPWELSAGALIAANCLFRQLSPSTRCCQAGLARIDPDLERALRDLGGSPWRVFSDLLLPLLRPFMAVAFVNSFSAAMTSTGPIIFLVTPYAKVASVELFDAINQGDFGAASAMGSLLILTVLAVNFLAWRAAERSRHVGL